jgi:hypothetical protein
MSEPVTDLDTFKTFLRDRARETWDERQSPYYLSYVATDLKKLGVDYRELVGPLKLSQWAASSEVPDTVLVSHPTQRARIGFVPSDSGFEFDTAEAASEGESRPKGPNVRTRSLVQFVQTLADLPEDAVADLSVPAKTLIALLQR